MIPFTRLTTIVMPHRAAKPSLRPRSNVTLEPTSGKDAALVSDFRNWTSIKLLKYGLEKRLYKKKGWLFDLLTEEGCRPFPPFIVLYIW
jgi:hypothetical protein